MTGSKIIFLESMMTGGVYSLINDQVVNGTSFLSVLFVFKLTLQLSFTLMRMPFVNRL